MRVSTIFAQGGGGQGYDNGCDYGCDSGCGDYFNRRGSRYYNGYNDRHHDYDDYRYDRGGLLEGLLG